MIIGDGACGKTSLLSVFTLGYFPTVSLILEQAPTRGPWKQSQVANMSLYRSIMLVLSTSIHPVPTTSLTSPPPR